MNHLDYLAKPPIINPIRQIITPMIISNRSQNDIPVHQIRKGGSQIVLIELIFHAGRPVESKKMVASSCGALMREGAGDLNSAQLSEEIDFLGASLSTSASLDFITIKGVCLKSQLSSLIDIIKAVISKPHFSEHEWEHFKAKSKERLKVQLAKPDILSYRTITESMYGSDHPYGYNSAPHLYDDLDINDLKEHHYQFITAQNCHIFLAGDITNEDSPLIDGLCSAIPVGSKKRVRVLQERNVTKPKEINLVGRESQTSIRLGRMGITRIHKDFDGLNYLCTVLGGYFGSRLVSHIREDKGLTYNIYCSLDCQLYDGDLMISTEVANENVQLCVDEIYQEMDVLCEDLIDDQELELVNNYMMGNYLNLFDGPFNSMRAIKSLALADIPLDELNSLIKSSLAINAHQIRELARKYYNRNDFWKVIVGTPQE